MEPTRRRQLLTDIAVVVATACWPLLLRTEAVAGDVPWPTGGRLWLEASATVFALVVLLGRRRRPTLVALAILPASVSAFAVVPSMVALYTVAARRSRTQAVTIAFVYVAVALASTAVLSPPEVWLSHTLSMVTFHAVPVTLGMVRQARVALLHELQDRATRAESEQQLRVEQARRLERQRMAREMHDVVAHRISLVSLHAGGLANWPDAPPREVTRAAEVIRASAHDALEELRGVIRVLRETDETAEPERPQPTLADLPELFARCRAAGTTLTVDDHTADAPPIPAAVGRTAYRVIEEALTNAAKHAPRAAVTVTLDVRSGDALSLDIVNPLPLYLRSGRGVGTVIPGAGAGLVGLTERVTVAGGRLEHGPTGDGRFRLHAELPWTS